MEAATATGDPARVLTLADAGGAARTGASMLEATPDRAPGALAATMPLLAAGALTLKQSRSLPMAEVAEAHRLLESGETRDKIVLTLP